MTAQVHTPEEYFGVISGDLNARRAVITGTQLLPNYCVIDAEVPLSETFGYVTRLRSMSQGRASVALTPVALRGGAGGNRRRGWWGRPEAAAGPAGSPLAAALYLSARRPETPVFFAS